MSASRARRCCPKPGLAQRLILQEPYVAALPRAHPLAARRSIALAELSDDAFVLYPARPEPSVTGLIVAACAAAGFAPRLAQEVLHLQTAIGLIAAGVGVSLVPEAAARAQTGRGVAYIPARRTGGDGAAFHGVARGGRLARRAAPARHRGTAGATYRRL